MNDERPNSSRGHTPLLLVGVALAGLAGASEETATRLTPAACGCALNVLRAVSFSPFYSAAGDSTTRSPQAGRRGLPICQAGE